MPVELADQAGTAVITCDGELDSARPQLLEAVQQVLEGDCRHVVVDMLDVSFIDSSVVRGLLIALSGTSERGGWVRVVYSRPIIGKVLRICGLGEVLPQYTSVAEALRGAAADGRAEGA